MLADRHAQVLVGGLKDDDGSGGRGRVSRAAGVGGGQAGDEKYPTQQAEGLDQPTQYADDGRCQGELRMFLAKDAIEQQRQRDCQQGRRGKQVPKGDQAGAAGGKRVRIAAVGWRRISG